MTIKKYLPLITVLILALTLRLWSAFVYGDMWADELFHVVYSGTHDLSHFWYLMTLETNPPLYTCFLKIWLLIFPATELSFRLTNVIIGTGSIFALYIFAKKLFNKHIALLAALILTLYPYHIFMSVTIRAYVLLMLLTIVSTYYFYCYFIEQSHAKKHLILYLIFTTILLYSHLTALGVVVTHAVIRIYLKKNLRQWLLYILIPLSAYMIWLIPSFMSKSSSSFGTSWFFLLGDGHHLYTLLQSLFTGSTSNIHLIFTIILFVTGVAYTIYKKHTDKKFVILCLLFFIPFVSALGMQLWHVKFFAITIPWIALLSAYILYQIKIFHRTLIMAIIFIPAIIPFFTTYFPLQTWASTNQYLTTHKNTSRQLLINDNISMIHEMDYYDTVDIPILHFYIENNYATLDEKYIRENYLAYIRDTQDIDTWIEKNNINTYDELFLLQSKPEQIYLDEELEHYGWNIQDIFETDLIGNTTIIYLTK